MLHIISGAAGSGKSTAIANEIISDLRDKRRVFLIVPEQEAVTAEKKITELAERDAKSSDVTATVPTAELEILSFSRLANHVFRTYGGLSYNYITPAATALVMWRTLTECAPMLTEYSAVSPFDKNIISLFCRTVRDMKQYGNTPEMLAMAAKQLSVKGGRLSGVLSDLAVIYAAYEALLHNDYDDPSDDLAHLAEVLDDRVFFSGSSVYIDSFSGFTPSEYGVLSHIILQADKVTVGLCISEESAQPIFRGVKKTREKLCRIAERFGTECKETRLGAPLRFKNNELRYLEANLWSFENTAPFTPSPHIGLIVCRDLFFEAEAAAVDILRRVKDGGRFSDNAVIVRSLDRYNGVIDMVFEKYGIPFFMSKRTDLSTKPIIKLVLSALKIHYDNFRYTDIIAYLKTGLTGIPDDDINILENYLSVWCINGKRWVDEYDFTMNPLGYTGKMGVRENNILISVNQTKRRLIEPLTKLFEAIENMTVSGISAALYAFLDETGALKASPAEVVNCLVDALDTLVSICGEENVTTEEYSGLFSIVIGYSDIGRIPSTVDEVIIGSAGTLRIDSTKNIYILGVNSGVFPQNPTDDGFFNDTDKRLLSELGLELPRDTDDLSYDELFLFYRCTSCASENLTLICSASEIKGEVLKPSSGFMRIMTLFDKKPLVYENSPPLDKIYGYDASCEYAALYGGTPLGDALYTCYSADSAKKELIDAYKKPVSTGVETLSSELSSRLFGGDITYSSTRLEKYVSCEFSHFCTYILSLREIKKAELDSVNIGNFVHDTLERFLNKISTPDGIDLNLSGEEIKSLADSIIDTYIENLTLGGMPKTKRLEQLLGILRRTLLLLIGNLISEFSQSEFIPKYFELSVPSDELELKPLDVPLSDGSHAYVVGKIDRVDTLKKGKDVYIRIIDYKTGNKDFKLSDVEEGLNMQMLLYLFSLWQSKSRSFRKALGCEEGGGVFPAGVLYLSAKPPDISVEAAPAEEDALSLAEGEIKHSGLLIDDKEVLFAMNKPGNKYIPEKSVKSLEEFGALMEQIKATLGKIADRQKGGHIDAAPCNRDICKYCKMKPVCRHTGAFENSKSIPEGSDK